MSLHRFPFALLVAVVLLAHSAGAMAASVPAPSAATRDDVAGKKDDTPLPKPKPTRGPRDGGDEN